MRDPQKQQRAVDTPLHGVKLDRAAKKERNRLIAAIAVAGIVSIDQPSVGNENKTLADQIPTYDDPQTIVMWREIEALCTNAVMKLTKDRQELYQLQKDGATAAEVAEMFGVTEHAIRARYRTLRKQLANLVNDEDLIRRVQSSRSAPEKK